MAPCGTLPAFGLRKHRLRRIERPTARTHRASGPAQAVHGRSLGIRVSLRRPGYRSSASASLRLALTHSLRRVGAARRLLPLPMPPQPGFVNSASPARPVSRSR